MGIILLGLIVWIVCTLIDSDSGSRKQAKAARRPKPAPPASAGSAWHPQWVHAAVVGVTYDGRQAVVARMRPGDPVTLRREPDNPYDRNAVRVENAAGEQAGFLDRRLAADLAPRLDRAGGCLAGQVTEAVGGEGPGYHCGLRIRFYVQ